MRLMPASSAADQRPSNLRVTPGRSSDVVAKRILSLPNDSASDAAAAELKVLCPLMYAGDGGVVNKDVHFSSDPSRMEVMGLKKSKVNLITQQRIPASARLMFRCAKSRAFSARELRRSRAIVWAMRFQWPGGVTVPASSAQKCAISVCSFVRRALSLP